MGTVQDDQKEIEALTVQELKATLRQAFWNIQFLFHCLNNEERFV